MLWKIIKDRAGFLCDPKEAFLRYEKQVFETSVQEYLLLLITESFLAGLVNFLWAIIKAAYYDIMYEVDIKYNFLINYAVGNAVGLMFFYLFSGIFLLFAASFILNIFLKMRYVRLLQLMFLSLTPVLLFGWVPFMSFTLLLWSLFLFISGFRQFSAEKIKKRSIRQRD